MIEIYDILCFFQNEWWEIDSDRNSFTATPPERLWFDEEYNYYVQTDVDNKHLKSYITEVINDLKDIFWKDIEALNLTPAEINDEDRMLREICVDIDYDWGIDYDYEQCYFFKYVFIHWYSSNCAVQLSAKDVIFTQEFLDKYMKYLEKTNKMQYYLDLPDKMFKNSDKIVKFLYDIIKYE